MASRQRKRSEETMQAIVEAAGKLFSERGFETVTMREIAKEAGCSHTTIYIYFQDKEALLHALAMPLLEDLTRELDRLRQGDDTDDDEAALKEMTLAFIRFSMRNRAMYAMFLITKGSRVDAEPGLAVNEPRFALFGRLSEQVRRVLGLPEGDERVLACGRIFFYMLNGIVTTYAQSEESYDELQERLGETFGEAIEAMIAGLKARVAKGGEIR